MNIRFVLRTIIICALCTSFFWHLYYGKNGIKAYNQLCSEVHAASYKKEALEQTIVGLEAEITTWQTDSFVKEKVAREDLLYSYTNEYVYILPKAKT